MRSTSCRLTVCLAAAGVLGAGAISYHAGAQAEEPPEPAPARADLGDVGRLLVEGLTGAEGCLGVETASTDSGKVVIFAWFENAEAVRDWYHGRAHRGVMSTFMRGERPDQRPLAHVGNEETPVLVIASLTPADAESLEQFKLPISQIAIELYMPLPGGTAINGRLAPDGVVVPHMNEVRVGPPPERE